MEHAGGQHRVRAGVDRGREVSQFPGTAAGEPLSCGMKGKADDGTGVPAELADWPQ